MVRPASAESTTERSSSILIFPKVIYNASRDTVIQISNTSNSMAHAHCFYVNATPLCIGSGDCLAGTCTGICEPQWQEVDFDIWLTKQQPTHWTASLGRFTNPNDEPCDRNTGNYDCDSAGLDPGRVPPVSSFPFQGELRCIEVDQSGAPISGNHLKGEATLVTTDGQATKYNAVGLLGEPFTNNGDNILCLGGGVSDDCPSGAEYEGCGARDLLTHFSGGADNPLFGPTSTVETEVTLVPCRADYETQEADRVYGAVPGLQRVREPLLHQPHDRVLEQFRALRYRECLRCARDQHALRPDADAAVGCQLGLRGRRRGVPHGRWRNVSRGVQPPRTG